MQIKLISAICYVWTHSDVTQLKMFQAILSSLSFISYIAVIHNLSGLDY